MNLGVTGGATMNDPDALLQGTGRVHRHVTIAAAQALADPALRRLLATALAARRAAWSR